MIKVFTTNKNGKIELTKEELKALLDEAYWDGYRAHNGIYVYSMPTWEPYKWNITCDSSAVKMTLSNNIDDLTRTLASE